MYSSRRLYVSVSQKAADVFNAAQSVARQLWPRQWHLPLSQASTSTTKLHVLSRAWKLIVYVLCVFSLLYLFAGYWHGYGMPSSPVNTASRPSRADVSRDQYIAAVLRDPVEGLVDPDPIREKCDGTKFHEGLIWHCAAVNGGIGNIVNMILNCVRYAIEAGATTLILPHIASRADNLVDLGSEDKSVQMSYLVDADYFLDSWKAACPQIHAVVSDSQIPDLPPITAELSPNTVKSFEMRKYLIVNSTGWREAFDKWMARNPAFQTMSAETPVRVWQKLAFAQWNRESQPLKFAHSFPRLFRHPPQVRQLAASALWNLEQKLGHPIVADTILFSSEMASPLSKVNSLGPGRLVPHGFLGAHLRVAADAAAAGWPGYEAQAPFYISEAKRLNLSAIYLATGSDENREKFRQDATREGLMVIVKEDLLDKKELAELRGLSWDQQALVDFDILLRSTQFVGFVRSSFSWALALRRGTLPEAGSVVWSQGDYEYRDYLSAVVGRHENINPEGLWP